jgi:hypothetical protein
LRTTGEERPVPLLSAGDSSRVAAKDRTLEATGFEMGAGGGSDRVVIPSGGGAGIVALAGRFGGKDAVLASISQSGSPTFTVAPSGARILTIRPPWGAGTSLSALSVATETTACSRLTTSPSCTSHFVIVPSMTLSPKLGITKLMDIRSSSVFDGLSRVYTPACLSSPVSVGRRCEADFAELAASAGAQGGCFSVLE